MSLLEYLEIVLTVLEDINNNLNEYYKNSVILSNRSGAMPIKLTIDNEGLALIVKKRHSYYGEDEEVISKAHFHKSSLSNYYNIDDNDIYSFKPEVLASAVEYANEEKKLFTKLYERKSFYHDYNRVIMEFNDKKQDKMKNEIVISYEYEGYKSYNLYIDIDKRKLETTDEFTLDLLKSIQVPDDFIIDEIKEKLYSNNFPIHKFSDEELIISKWVPDPPKPKSRKINYFRRSRLW